MQRMFISIFLLILLILPSAVHGATLENLDFNDYRIGIRYSKDTVIYQTLFEQASLYGICEYGCLLILIDTGQQMVVKPEDYIVIEDGALRRKE